MLHYYMVTELLHGSILIALKESYEVIIIILLSLESNKLIILQISIYAMKIHLTM